ncbi:DUF4234 domain-containing protein [Desulfovibrio litoralis]|uniref:DUF4234 domain-containing protein n=1 Tax=Desulfovibrio litoralis DSM 11393 TaxID=1121455 RepID=A0A1M7T2N1_9BACT|nr:DUF4234 domain-containing protein [Desulfovibrio litoralis]SHN64959.1 hypothetical protein SAMN02745728_01478 [Desulfovibrio litoralis DSM 11393]
MHAGFQDTTQNKIIDDNTLETEQSLVSFIFLTIITLGFYNYYWLLNLVKRLNKLQQKTICSPSLVIISVCLSAWWGVLYTAQFIFHYTQYSSAVELLGLINSLLDLFILIKIKQTLLSLVKEKRSHLQVLWIVLFQEYYYYYVIRKTVKKNEKLLSNA